MKFVILSRGPIPGYGVTGPILSPAEYDIHLVLRWIGAGVDIREVMEDGSYRKLSVNDERINEELNRKINERAAERRAIREQLEREGRGPKPGPRGNVQLPPERHHRKPVMKRETPKSAEEVNKENRKDKLNRENLKDKLNRENLKGRPDRDQIRHEIDSPIPKPQKREKNNEKIELEKNDVMPEPEENKEEQVDIIIDELEKPE